MGKDEAVTDVSGRSVGLAGALIDISGEGARSLVSTGVVGAEMTIGVDVRSREGTAMFGVLEAAAASMESLFNKRTASVKATNASCRCVARLDAIDATDAEGTSASEAVTSQGQSRCAYCFQEFICFFHLAKKRRCTRELRVPLDGVILDNGIRGAPQRRPPCYSAAMQLL